MPTKDPYKLLGVPREASEDEVRKAYRRLARQHHPDANPDAPAAEERFKEIQHSYEVLSNPEKRRQYDERFRASARKSRGGSRIRNTSQVDLADLLAKRVNLSGDRASGHKDFCGRLRGNDVARIARLLGMNLDRLSGLLGEAVRARAHLTIESGGGQYPRHPERERAGQGITCREYKKPPIPPIPRKLSKLPRSA